MPQQDFEAQVSAWVTKTRARMLAVRNESAQRVVEVMQTPVGQGGNLPVDTGFMRASLTASIGTGNFALKTNPNPDGKFSYDAGAVSLVIAKAKVEEPLEFVYTANYARMQEYGSRGRDGRRFVALAASQWPRIVSEVSREAQQRVEGS